MQALRQPPPQSTFITVLAWIFIVLSGFTILMAILQNVMFSFMFNSAEFRRAPDMPAFLPVLFRVFMLGMLAFFAFELWAAIALLKRKNWARIFFIVLMVLGLLHSVASILLMICFPMPVHLEGMTESDNMVNAFNAMRIGMSLFALCLAALWGWILKRLLSREIRQEFLPPAAI